MILFFLEKVKKTLKFTDGDHLHLAHFYKFLYNPKHLSLSFQD